jgi:hypothetical protein
MDRIRTSYSWWWVPLLLLIGGVASDYITTLIGLGRGFYETHAQYHPLWASLFFGGAFVLLALTMPRKKPWSLGVYGLAIVSYLGAVNNLLVILGVFTGLHL